MEPLYFLPLTLPNDNRFSNLSLADLAVNFTRYTSGCFSLSDINMSQGSVAMRLRCGGIFYNIIPRNLLLTLLVKAQWPYLSNGLTDRREIWHRDAFLPS